MSEDQDMHVSAIVDKMLSPEQKAAGEKHLAETAQEREAYVEKMRQELERKRQLFQNTGHGA